jgi:flavin-dependent dehydrogenase
MIDVNKVDRVILGAGPVGMASALALSDRYRVALLTDRLPDPAERVRIESVPATLLAMLVNFNIHPFELGVNRFYECNTCAWETNLPITKNNPATAHIQRPALDWALLKKISSKQNIQIVTTKVTSELCEELRTAMANRKTIMIDATGRRAITVTRKLRPIPGWACRTFWIEQGKPMLEQQFMLTALPFGYVYRLGTSEHVMLGIVGNGPLLQCDGTQLTQYLRDLELGWILDGLPNISKMIPGKVAPSSVQWSNGDPATIRLGDSALARDPLSSQGIACGLSEALYMASLDHLDDRNLFIRRQNEQRQAHLHTLRQLLSTCRYHQSPTWKAYLDFINRNILRDSDNRRIALKNGKLSQLNYEVQHYAS